VRILVTGCAGFIGSHLSEYWVNAGHEVVGVDCFTDYYPRAAKEANLRWLRDQARFSLREVDLAEAPLEPLVDGVHLVYHQAGQPGVRASWGRTFESYVRNNVLATQRLLEAMKGQPIKKFVYASSSSIYGDAEAFPTDESALPRPVSPYGVTKLSGEQLAYLYWRNYGLPTVALRYFTVYGPRQRPDMAFHRFIRWALEREPIQVYGDGEQTRDFTFVSDAVAANVAAGTSDAVGVAMNIGGGSQVSVNQVLRLIEQLLERPVQVSYSETARGDVRHTSADTQRAAGLLRYHPKVRLEAGLAAELEWLRGSEPADAARTSMAASHAG